MLTLEFVDRLRAALLALEQKQAGPVLDITWLRRRCDDTIGHAGELQRASLEQLHKDILQFVAEFPRELPVPLADELSSLQASRASISDVQSSWDDALEMLRVFVHGVTSFAPDEVDRAAKADGKSLQWQRIEDFDRLCDTDIWRTLSASIHWDAEATVVVIADVCYIRKTAPLVVKSKDLGRWIETFAATFGDSIFGGDAALVCSDGAVLVHHEGLYAILLR